MWSIFKRVDKVGIKYFLNFLVVYVIKILIKIFYFLKFWFLKVY